MEKRRQNWSRLRRLLKSMKTKTWTRSRKIIRMLKKNKKTNWMKFQFINKNRKPKRPKRLLKTLISWSRKLVLTKMRFQMKNLIALLKVLPKKQQFRSLDPNLERKSVLTALFKRQANLLLRLISSKKQQDWLLMDLRKNHNQWSNQSLSMLISLTQMLQSKKLRIRLTSRPLNNL